MATEKLYAVLETAQKDYYRQDSAFDSLTFKLQQESIMPVGIRLGSLEQQLAFNLEVVRKFADATKKHCAACDALILALDATARPLLEKNPTAQAVGDVLRFMQKVESDVAGIDIDFGVSFDGLDVGSVGSFRPMLCTAAQAIVMIWNNHYCTMPDYQKDQDRLKAEEEKRKQHKREREEQIQKWNDAAKLKREEKIQVAHEIAAHKEEVRQECDRRINEYESQLNQAKEECHAHLLEVEKARLLTEKQNAEENLSRLKLFDFKEKKPLRKAIKACKKSLSRLKLSEEIGRQLEAVVATESDRYRQAVNTYFDKRFVLAETVYDISYYGTGSTDYDKLYSLLSYTPITLREISDKCVWSQSKTHSMLSTLQKESYVVRSGKMGCYEGSYAFNPDKVKQVELWKDTKPTSEVPAPAQSARESFRSLYHA